MGEQIKITLGGHKKQNCVMNCEATYCPDNIEDCKAKCQECCPNGNFSCNDDDFPNDDLQCYNLGDKCEVDSDCLTWGFNPCNKCGQYVGTRYYKRCYAEEPTPEPTPAPFQCYNLGQRCTRNQDCHTGGVNFCQKCGTAVGTRYYHQCYSSYEE